MTRNHLTIGIFVLLALGLIPLAVRTGAEPRVFELTMRAGSLPEDQRLIRVQQGDEVTLKWTTDKPVTVHLHGYDIERKLSPKAPTTMRFSARATGRFAIEVHGSNHGQEETIAYLEVHPR